MQERERLRLTHLLHHVGLPKRRQHQQPPKLTPGPPRLDWVMRIPVILTIRHSHARESKLRHPAREVVDLQSSCPDLQSQNPLRWPHGRISPIDLIGSETFLERYSPSEPLPGSASMSVILWVGFQGDTGFGEDFQRFFKNLIISRRDG
jgi:hypothetical protein